MNAQNKQDFENGIYNISFNYILSDASRGSMSYDLSYLLKNPAADLNIILKTALYSDIFADIFARVADFIEYSQQLKAARPEKIDALKKVLNKYTPDGFIKKAEKKTGAAAVAEKYAKKLFKDWDRPAGRRFWIDGEKLYIFTTSAGIRLPISAAGLYIDVINGMDEDEKNAHKIKPGGLMDRGERFTRLDYITTLPGDTKKIKGADYYANGASEVLIDEKYSKYFKGLDLYTIPGADAHKIPVYFASPETDADGQPIFCGIILPLFMNPWIDALTAFKRATAEKTPAAPDLETAENATNSPAPAEVIQTPATNENSPATADTDPATASADLDTVKTETAAPNIIPRYFNTITARVMIDTNFLKPGDVVTIKKNPEGANYIASTPGGAVFYLFASHLRNGNIFKFLSVDTAQPDLDTDPAAADLETASPETAPAIEKSPAPAAPDIQLSDNITLSDALLFLAMNKKSNSNIILSAALESGAASLDDFKKYAFEGIMPRIHTFEAWRESGYIVQKGQRAAFSALIWKRIEKKRADGDPEQKFILKNSYFFTADQVKAIENN